MVEKHSDTISPISGDFSPNFLSESREFLHNSSGQLKPSSLDVCIMQNSPVFLAGQIAASQELSIDITKHIASYLPSYENGNLHGLLSLGQKIGNTFDIMEVERGNKNKRTHSDAGLDIEDKGISKKSKRM